MPAVQAGASVIHIDDGSGHALCKGIGQMVVAALESDCKTCREIQMIAPVNDKNGEVRPPSEWDPQPPFRDKNGNIYEKRKV